MAIGTTVKIGWDATKVQRGMKRMKSRFGSFASEISGALKTGMKRAVLAITAAFAALTYATVSYFNRFRKEMDRIGKIARRFGVGTDEVQKLGTAAELSGANLEVLTKGLQTLTRYAIKAGQEGGATYARAFESLNINAAAFAQMGMTEQILELNRAFMAGGRDAEKFAAILEVMGARSGGELIPLIGMNQGRLREMLGSVRVVSAEVIEKMQEINDRWLMVKQNFKADFGEAIAKSVPAIEGFIEKIETMGMAITSALAGDPALFRAGLDYYEELLKEWSARVSKNVAERMAGALAGAGESGARWIGRKLTETGSPLGAIYGSQADYLARMKAGIAPMGPSADSLLTDAVPGGATRGMTAAEQKLAVFEATKEGVKEGMKGAELMGPLEPWRTVDPLGATYQR